MLVIKESKWTDARKVLSEWQKCIFRFLPKTSAYNNNYNFLIWAIKSSRLCSVSCTVSPLGSHWFKTWGKKISAFESTNASGKAGVLSENTNLSWNGVSHSDALWEVRHGAWGSLQLCVSHLWYKFNTCTADKIICCSVTNSDKLSQIWHGLLLTPLVVLMYDRFLFFLNNFNLWPLCFFPLKGNNSRRWTPFSFWAYTASVVHPDTWKQTASAHLVLLLLSPAEAVVTLGVGFHGHGGEEVLHGVVAKIITDSAKL